MPETPARRRPAKGGYIAVLLPREDAQGVQDGRAQRRGDGAEHDGHVADGLHHNVQHRLHPPEVRLL